MIRNAQDIVAEFSLSQANDLVRAGQLADAKNVYNHCIDAESDNSAAWYGLGVANYRLGDEDAAIVAFERAFLLNRFHAPTAANLAVLYDGRDATAAQRFARSAIELGIENETLTAIIDSNSRTQSEPEDSSSPIVETALLENQATEIQPSDNSEPVIIGGAVTVDSDEPPNLLDEAQDFIDNGDFERALGIISPALESDESENAQLWYLCGVCLVSLELNEDAVNTLAYCLELDQTHFEATQLLRELDAQSQSALQTIEEEIEPTVPADTFTPSSEMFEPKVVEYSPETEIIEEPVEFVEEEDSESPFIALEDSRVVLVKQATEASRSGDHSRAVQTWKRIIEEFGSTSESWSGMADALDAAGHFAKGEQCRLKASELQALEEASESKPENEVDLLAAAAEAREQVVDTFNQDSDDVNVAIEWYNKGLTLLSEEKGIEALNSFEKAISTSPREERELRVRAHTGRGHALHQLGRFAESIQSYHQAISMDPSMVSGRTLYNMGSSYAAMEHFQDAIRCFEQALERDLDSEELKLCQTQMNRCSLLLKEQIKAQKLNV